MVATLSSPHPHWGGGPTTETITVTPELAQRWLEHHNGPHNRTIRWPHVNRWATEILEGRWMLTHQGPAFDTERRLIDGQHRLAAVVQTGIAVPMRVTFGVAPETYTVVDTGLVKQAGHLVPGPNATLKAATARLLYNAPKVFDSKRAFSNRDAIRIVEEHPAMDEAAVLAGRIRKYAKINSACMCALLTLALESPTVAPCVDGWVDGLATGAGLRHGDPRLVIRNRWSTESGANALNKKRNEGLYLIVRGWNAYVNNRQVTRLQLPAGGINHPDQIPEVAL